MDAVVVSLLGLHTHRFKDAAHAVGHQGAPVVGQQVKHHRQELLLHLLVSQGREEGLGHLDRDNMNSVNFTDRPYQLCFPDIEFHEF